MLTTIAITAKDIDRFNLALTSTIDIVSVKSVSVEIVLIIRENNNTSGFKLVVVLLYQMLYLLLLKILLDLI